MRRRFVTKNQVKTKEIERKEEKAIEKRLTELSSEIIVDPKVKERIWANIKQRMKEGNK